MIQKQKCIHQLGPKIYTNFGPCPYISQTRGQTSSTCRKESSKITVSFQPISPNISYCKSYAIIQPSLPLYPSICFSPLTFAICAGLFQKLLGTSYFIVPLLRRCGVNQQVANSELVIIQIAFLGTWYFNFPVKGVWLPLHPSRSSLLLGGCLEKGTELKG